MRVAFCGMGHMGRAMAANLVAAGHDVRAWNRTPGKAPPGAREFSSIREAAASAEVAITMLADDAAVEGVARELLDVLGPGGVHCSMSTISVKLSRSLAERHRERGQRYLAAPVFGRPEAAEARKLWIVPAGDSDALRACQPLFEALGQGTIPLGGVAEHASLTKICGNFLIASLIELFGEALTLGEKAGLDAREMAATLSRIIFAGAPIPSGYAARVASTEFEPAAFALRLGHKDVSLAVAAADEAKAPMPIASLLHDHFLASLAKGRGDWDWGGLAAVLRESAGLPPRRG
jgi:3-hydroxyisobutyrate dehydrogenase-like beta-hydroxyacid dehydrogenase